MTANDWILPWFMLVRIMYIMLNTVCMYSINSCPPHIEVIATFIPLFFL